MVGNLKRFVFPYLDELAQAATIKDAQTYADVMRANIEQLVAPVTKSVNMAYLDFTPTEIKVADLVRQGESTKSIAAMLRTSPSTVEKHRNKIRKKLKLLNKKINLRTYLNSLA
jgi:DNA-binding NarL/FixJ family response regulator